MLKIGGKWLFGAKLGVECPDLFFDIFKEFSFFLSRGNELINAPFCMNPTEGI